MNQLPDEFKGKAKRRGRTSPLDFVVPLQLEECVHRIEQLPVEAAFHFTVERTDDADQMKFRLMTDPSLTTAINASGTLRRWEGTSTRFEGELKIYNALWRFEEFFLLFVLPFLLVLFGFTFYLILLALLPSLRNAPWHNPLFYALASAPPGLWLVVKWTNQRRTLDVQHTIRDMLLNQSSGFFTEKYRRSGRTTSLDFRLPLPLPACLERIDQLSSKADLRFTLEPTDDPDLVGFRLSSGKRQTNHVETQGTLQNWQDTATHFEGKVQIHHILSQGGQLFLIIGLPALLILGSIIVHLLVLIFIPALRHLSWDYLLIYVLIGAVPGTLLTIKQFNHRRGLELQEQIKQALLKEPPKVKAKDKKQHSRQKK